MPSTIQVTFDKTQGSFPVGEIAHVPYSDAVHWTSPKVGIAHLTTEDELAAFAKAAIVRRSGLGPAEEDTIPVIVRSYPRFSPDDSCRMPRNEALVAIENNQVIRDPDPPPYAPPRSRQEITAARLEAAESDPRGRAPAQRRAEKELAERKEKKKARHGRRSPADREADPEVTK